MKFGHRGYVNRFVLYCLQLPLGCFALVVFTVKSIFVQLLKGFCLFPRKRNMTCEYSAEDVKRGNEFVDELLEDVTGTYGDDYDPYTMKDYSMGFHKKVAFVNVSGEIKFHNGYITGMKSLHRTGDCVLKREGDRIKVQADLGAGVLDFYYSGSVKFMSMGPTMSVHGILHYVEVYWIFNVDANTGKDGVLEKLSPDDMRGMEVKFTGLGPFNWIINYCLSALLMMFRGYIQNQILSTVGNHLRDRMRQFEFPVSSHATTAQDILQSSYPESI